MEPAEYPTLFALEPTHWWFRGVRLIVLDVLRNHGVAPQTRLVDAGCGLGSLLLDAAETLTPHAYGFDISALAAPYWSRRLLPRTCVASVNETPFPDRAFDVALGINLFESEAVNERRALAEMFRVVRPGGLIVLLVPAYRFLAAPWHARAADACHRYVRRYSRAEMVRLARALPVEIVRLTYVFGGILPAMFAARTASRHLGRHRNLHTSELFRLPGWLNALLFGMVRLEARILRRMSMPFGSSLLMVLRKERAR